MEVHRNVSQKESLDLLGFTRSVVGGMLSKPMHVSLGQAAKEFVPTLIITIQSQPRNKAAVLFANAT